MIINQEIQTIQLISDNFKHPLDSISNTTYTTCTSKKLTNDWNMLRLVLTITEHNYESNNYHYSTAKCRRCDLGLNNNDIHWSRALHQLHNAATLDPAAPPANTTNNTCAYCALIAQKMVIILCIGSRHNRNSFHVLSLLENDKPKSLLSLSSSLVIKWQITKCKFE